MKRSSSVLVFVVKDIQTFVDMGTGALGTPAPAFLVGHYPLGHGDSMS